MALIELISYLGRKRISLLKGDPGLSGLDHFLFSIKKTSLKAIYFNF